MYDFKLFTVYLVSKIHSSPSSFIQTTMGVRATGVSEPWQPWASSVILKSWGIFRILENSTAGTRKIPGGLG